MFAIRTLLAFGLCCAIVPAHAQQLPIPPRLDPRAVEVKSTQISANVWMLEGDGGNIGVSVGPDGVLLVDDEFASLAPKIRTALTKLSSKPVRFVVNTHWHPDHTDGNGAMAQAGATIIAQENVRRRLSTPQLIGFLNQQVPPSSPAAWPVISYRNEMALHLNGDDIWLIHLPNAHTDGDTVVYFRHANVIHMGDLLLTNGSYPIIDYSSGGTIDGYIGAPEKVLSMSRADTRIIPGHGPATGRDQLQETLEMVRDVRAAVSMAAADRRTLEGVIAAKPTSSWDAKWGHGFVTPDVFVAMIYRTLPRN